MIIRFVITFSPTCLPSGLTVAAPDAFGRIPGVLYDTDKILGCLTFWFEYSYLVYCIDVCLVIK